MLLHIMVFTVLLNLLKQCSALPYDPSNLNSLTTIDVRTPEIILGFWNKCPIEYRTEAEIDVQSEVTNYSKNDTCGEIYPPKKDGDGASLLVNWLKFDRIKIYKNDKCQSSMYSYTLVRGKGQGTDCIDLTKLGYKIASFKMWAKPKVVRDMGHPLD